MNVSGLNLLSPTIQAKEVHVSLVDTVHVKIPGTKNKSLSLGTDIGIMGAIGLEPIEDDQTAGSTNWQLALKFANSSKEMVAIESIQILLHEKGNLQLVSDPSITDFYELSQKKTVIPKINSRDHKNILPILLSGESEKSYLITTLLRLQQVRSFRKPVFVEIPMNAIKEPETYRHYFNTCKLVIKTSVGKLKIKFRVPLFVGDRIRIPNEK